MTPPPNAAAAILAQSAAAQNMAHQNAALLNAAAQHRALTMNPTGVNGYHPLGTTGVNGYHPLGNAAAVAQQQATMQILHQMQNAQKQAQMVKHIQAALLRAQQQQQGVGMGVGGGLGLPPQLAAQLAAQQQGGANNNNNNNAMAILKQVQLQDALAALNGGAISRQQPQGELGFRV